jgi:hypothetical protein
LHAPGQPEMFESGIYLGRGAEQPAPARGNVIVDNRINAPEGFRERPAQFKSRIAADDCLDVDRPEDLARLAGNGLTIPEEAM